MSLERIIPTEGRVVLLEDGTRMKGPSVVDTSRQYYRNRLRDGDVALFKKPKVAKVKTDDNS